MSAGYRGTALAERLGLAAGMRVGLDDPPPEFVGLVLLPVPDDITLHTRIAGNMDIVIGFYDRRRDLEARLPVLRRRIPDDGAIWVCWQTRAADLDEEVAREVAAPAGLRGMQTCDIDEGWQGLKLVPDPAAPASSSTDG